MTDTPTATVFRPSRKFRREIHGAECPVCHLRMHANDVVAIRTADSLTLKTFQGFYLHGACAELLAAPAQPEEEDSESQGDESIQTTTEGEEDVSGA